MVVLVSVTAAAVLGLVRADQANAAYAEWGTTSSLLTDRGDFAATLGPDGRIYAIGGNSSVQGDLASGEAFTPETGVWSTIPDMPTARVNTVAATLLNQVYVLGGNTPAGLTRRVLTFTPATGTWSTATPMPAARQDLGAAVINGMLYVVGGNAKPTTANGTRTLWRFDPQTAAWTTLAPMPAPREYAGVVASGGRLYVIGGCCVGPTYPAWARTVFRYNPSTNTWSKRAPLSLANAHMGAASGIDGKIYVIGGIPPSDGALWVYTPTTNSWQASSSMPHQRASLRAVRGSDGSIYAIGGHFDGTCFGSDCGKYVDVLLR
jgi:N-acetylneuraminic acid mutarotase